MAKLDILEIQKILPHRFPFLLVDRIEELDDEHIVGIKNVTVNEPFFAGHFPGFPVMPGVLIVEAMAQVSGVLALHKMKGERRVVLLGMIERAKFRRPVVPGDQLRIEMHVDRLKASVAKMSGKAYVDGAVAAEVTVLCKLGPKIEGEPGS